MASLVMTFSELYEEVQKFTGEYNAGSPSTTATTDAKFVVNRAYLRLLNFHDWTFLRRANTLITESGKWVYEMPTDFGYLNPDEFIFDSDDAYQPTIPRTLAWLHAQRSSITWSSYPEFHVIYAGPYTKEVGQAWQVAFYPTPDSEYTLHYQYRITPQKLESDDDIPIGGPEVSDALLEMCLAYAEAYKDETHNVHQATVQQILSPLMDLDNRRRPKNLGNMGIPRRRPVYGEVIEGLTVTYIT